ncbi:homeodomain mating type protein alpha2 [Neofusicoccum ribis]|uniref:Homeodomain mating type protein alpha2 n=1 Tax=Neofusicoccum ribis TaxID=45134 RepID=A0ABR3SJ50_9PEZI
MDYGRQGSHQDDDMQAYFHPQHALMQPWSEPMQQQPEDIPWNYGGSASNWWLPHETPDQFGQFGHFPPQPSGAWPFDHYPAAPLDFQGAQFHPNATLPPPDFEPIPTTGQLIPDDELDSLLNPHPPGFPSDLEPNHPEFQGKQRVRQRISSPAKAILQKWFDDHIEDPYLEREDVSTLSEATGLTARQVRTFFANARARKLPGPAPSQLSPPAFSSTDSGRETKVARVPSSKAKQRQGGSVPPVKPDPGAQLRSALPRQQSPMQRYLSSSPEDEGVSEEALRHAAVSYAPQSSAQANTEGHGSAPNRNPDAYSEAASSNSSNSSHASIDSAVNRVPRRGRKRHRGSQRRSNTVVRERTDQSKIFQCTFCNRDFAQKYDWRRHEESVHIPQKEWICMPDGPVRAADDDSGLQFCVFCEQANPSYEHLQRHNYTPCLTAPQPSRTFTRKDKLIQHLGQVHKQSQMSPTMQTWCRRVSRNIAIACGICGVRLSTWNERVEHISTHFADGLDMRYWLGAPGGVVSFAPTPDGHHHHHHHHHYEQSSSSASTTNIDPLFPAYNPSTSSIPSQTGFHHPCTHCPARFPRYSETVFHERQAHRVYKIRPQPTEDGSNIMNPLQPRTEKLAFSGGGGGGAAGAAGGVGRGGAMASVMQQQRQHHRAADAPVAAMLLGGGSGRRSKALLGEDGQKGAGRGGGGGAGTGRPFWRDQR